MLDRISTFEKYDSQEVSYYVEHLPEQVHIAWRDTRELTVKKHKSIQNIVLVGMGGSGVAADLVSMVCKAYGSVPVTVVQDYELPNFVNTKTLVVLISFSGDTEEVLHAATFAKKKRAKIAVVTSGGKLWRFASRHNLDGYRFRAKEMAETPNQGMGLLFMGCVGLLERFGFLKVSKAKVARMIEAMTDVVDSCAINIDTEHNPAKTVAVEAEDRPVLFVGSEHLAAVTKEMAYRVNESAKQYARHASLPELNHHFLESLGRPADVFSRFLVLMVRSDLYHQRNGIRYEMTAEVFENLGATVIDYDAHGGEVLEEIGEMMQFGAFLTYYMGIQNKVDLTEVPYVNLIKQKMSKEK